jgi:hypothetical protein
VLRRGHGAVYRFDRGAAVNTTELAQFVPVIAIFGQRGGRRRDRARQEGVKALAGVQQGQPAVIQ